MTRRSFVGVVLLSGCRSSPELPPLPPKVFETPTGVRWTVQDARPVIPAGERPLPGLVADRLRAAEFAEPGVTAPTVAKLEVVSYRQTIVEPGTQGPSGPFQSVFSDASYGKSNPLKGGEGPAGALIQVGVLGFLELLNLGLFFGKTAVAVADQTAESKDEPGVTCELTARVQLTWADGRSKTSEMTARGWAVREANEKDYRGAAQTAQDQLAIDLLRNLWQAIRSGP